jgi:rhamnogalacturonyl hydrolase YesR
MITFAMLRGIREGWLNPTTYAPSAERGWAALKLRILLDGKSFVDACTGTGKQRSLRDYLRRTAILGPDDRSGAMALMVATERARWEKSLPPPVR